MIEHSTPQLTVCGWGCCITRAANEYFSSFSGSSKNLTKTPKILKLFEYGEKMLRQLTRASEIPKVVKQLQKVGYFFPHHQCQPLSSTPIYHQSSRQIHVCVSSSACTRYNRGAPWAEASMRASFLCSHNSSKQLRGRFNSSSFFGLFQSSAIAGTQKSNNYATEATLQVQRVSVEEENDCKNVYSYIIFERFSRW